MRMPSSLSATNSSLHLGEKEILLIPHYLVSPKMRLRNNKVIIIAQGAMLIQRLRFSFFEINNAYKPTMASDKKIIAYKNVAAFEYLLVCKT